MTPGTHPAPCAARDFVIGIDFGGTKVALATATRSGDILHGTRLETLATRGAAQVVERALRAARALASQTASRFGGRCLGVGAASPGIVGDDSIGFTPNIPGWESLALARELGRGLDLAEVACGNDVKAGGLAEARWGALRGADPGIFLSLGTGIAAALTIGGRVLGGAHGAAGEIGYLLRGVTDTAGVASGRAPLEDYVSGSGLARRGTRLLGVERSTAQLFESTDPRVRDLVADALDQLAVGVANMAIVVDPERIVVGGGLMASGERVLAALEARLREAVPFPPRVLPAEFVQDSALRGSVALILDRLADRSGV